LRTASDLEVESQIASFNRQPIGEDGEEGAQGINTVFFIPSEGNRCISSSAVREIVSAGGDASRFVPSYVWDEIRDKA